MKTLTKAKNKPQSNLHSSKPFFNKNGGETFLSDSKETETSFFSPDFIQSKLAIGQPQDKYEKEADQMSENVMQTLFEPESPALQKKQTATQRTNIIPTLQQKTTEENLEEHDKEVDNEEILQKKSIFESGNPSEDGTGIQKKSNLYEIER